MLAIARGGTYYRVFKPGWHDPLDTSFSRKRGGRWTPPGEFGALYLNATIQVAAANARSQHAGRAIGLFDLRPEKRPGLLDVEVPRRRVADVVTAAGVAAAGLPKDCPVGVTYGQCWPVARSTYGDPTKAGIASRSNAECTASHCAGEELAWFDRSVPVEEIQRRDFAQWYPGPHP